VFTHNFAFKELRQLDAIQTAKLQRNASMMGAQSKKGDLPAAL
jgi:hypothetical protein